MKPNFREEKILWRKGYRLVVGIDEAGRGALAGPVVAAAVMFDNSINQNRFNYFRDIKDSKQLSPESRERLYKLIISQAEIKWGIGKVSEKIIDKINIKNAAELAMERALKNLEKKVGRVNFLLVDGKYLANRYLKERNHKLIIRGDEKVFSCAAASILAKVTRDGVMRRYHKKYPLYGFDKHKGYATELHLKNISRHKPSFIHRQTFGPVYLCG